MLDGKVVERVEVSQFLDSAKTANGDCTNEIERRIAMAKEKTVKLDRTWKSKNYRTLAKVALNEDA